MLRHISPTVGNWYRDLQSGNVFEVVAWDTAQQTIETQLIDGEISELDVEAWSLLKLESIEEPEDWRNPYEMDGEDAIDPDEPMHPETWSNPVSIIEPEYTLGLDESYT
ncbi:MAG: hypothetical protein ACI9GW_000612 [Halieaceae bacterium]|jgi:hypothetical protein